MKYYILAFLLMLPTKLYAYDYTLDQAKNQAQWEQQRIRNQQQLQLNIYGEEIRKRERLEDRIEELEEALDDYND